MCSSCSLSCIVFTLSVICLFLRIRMFVLIYLLFVNASLSFRFHLFEPNILRIGSLTSHSFIYLSLVYEQRKKNTSLCLRESFFSLYLKQEKVHAYTHNAFFICYVRLFDCCYCFIYFFFW